jgi:hypothetical protein
MLVGIGSAQAGETANRQDLNGIRENGHQLNRLAFNRLAFNRLAFNGTGAELPQQLNGIPLHRVSIR